jgi:hypothetical protein
MHSQNTSDAVVLEHPQVRLIEAERRELRLMRAGNDAEYQLAAVIRSMKELRDADAIDADHAVQFDALITDLSLATSVLVAARAAS